MKTILFILTGFFIFTTNLFAQKELVTDRPDQTESSITVPHKSLQIETGFLMESKVTDVHEFKDFAYNTTLLRYGLQDNFELRVGLEYLASSVKTKSGPVNSTVNVDGFSPLYLGFKVMVREEDGILPEIAFLGGLNLPHTADEEYQTDYSAPSFRFAFSHTLSNMFSLGYNLGAEWDGFTADPEYYYSFVVGAAITENIGGFIETYGTMPEKSPSEHLVDAGLTWLVTPVFQLDISGGLGLNNEAIDNFVSLGFTYRIDR
jgi:hypothetical protein